MNRSQYIINIIGMTKLNQLVALEAKYEETKAPEDYEAYMKVAGPALAMVAAEDRARGLNVTE